MSYTGMQHIYWHSTWFCTDALRGGLYPMTFKD